MFNLKQLKILETRLVTDVETEPHIPLSGLNISIINQTLLSNRRMIITWHKLLNLDHLECGQSSNRERVQRGIYPGHP